MRKPILNLRSDKQQAQRFCDVIVEGENVTLEVKQDKDKVEIINWNDLEKSYESMLKIMLGSAKGNASALTQRYVEEKIHLPENVNVNGFKDSVLMSLPYIRNNCAAHGAGEANVVISKSLAHLAINMASSLNTYLIEEYKYSN